MASSELPKDPSEMFGITPNPSGYLDLRCHYGECGWFLPMVSDTQVNRFLQELYSHAYTNHGVRPV